MTKKILNLAEVAVLFFALTLSLSIVSIAISGAASLATALLLLFIAAVCFVGILVRFDESV